MCEECMRRDLGAVYRAGRRRAHADAWSVPCRTDDRLTDLVIRSAPVAAASSAPKRRKAKRSASGRKVR